MEKVANEMRETRFKIQWPNPDTLFLYYLLHIRKREAAFFLNYVEKSIAYGFGNLFKNLFKSEFFFLPSLDAPRTH